MTSPALQVAAADDPEQGRGLWAGLAVLGGLGRLFGSTAVAPAAVGALTPLGRRLRGSAFLALRNLGRQRARTSRIPSWRSWRRSR